MEKPLPRPVVGIFPEYNNGTAISYIASSIFGGFVSHGADARLWCAASDRTAQRPFMRLAVPAVCKRLAYRTVGTARIRALTEYRFLRSLRPGACAYVWPGYGPGLCRRVKERGAVLVLERINCHSAVARRILLREAEAAGMPTDFPITEDMIAAERADLALADFVFAPSPLVGHSLATEGVPEKKILAASYGWGAERISPAIAVRDRGDRAGGLRVLFVGHVCVRKGAHRLLDAWKQADIPGELLFAGRVTKSFAAARGEDFKRPNVRMLGHSSDISKIYASADVFVLPSFEEGSPLVTYEAMAAGLPVVVSPMGAGGVARDGAGAMVLQPEDSAAWANAFRRLLAEPDLRAEMGRRATERAEEFTWERCAKVRLDRLARALAPDGF